MMGILRTMSTKDLVVVRRWRNNPKVNRYMFSQHEITQEEHQQWFARSQKNPCMQLNVYVESNEINGFLQLQNSFPGDKIYEWGFYVSPDALKGTGEKMAKLALLKVFNEMNGKKVFGKVLSFNKPSISLHQKLGFYQEALLREHCCLNDKYHDVYYFGILKSEWVK